MRLNAVALSGIAGNDKKASAIAARGHAPAAILPILSGILCCLAFFAAATSIALILSQAALPGLPSRAPARISDDYISDNYDFDHDEGKLILARGGLVVPDVVRGNLGITPIRGRAIAAPNAGR